MDQLFFLFLLLLPIATLSSDVYHPCVYCEKNFTENKMLQANINNILFDMVAKSSLRGYAISSYAAADGNNSVYGVTRCQGDMSVQACSACITKTAQFMQTTCPNSAMSHIWYDECFLRYDTDNFLGKADNYSPCATVSANAVENPKPFKQALGELMGEMMAATTKGSKKFSYGEKYVRDKLTVYGMAQCTLDLGESECNACLEYEWEKMLGFCGNLEGCRFFGSSCFLRYEIYDFSFNATVGAAAPTPSITMINN